MLWRECFLSFLLLFGNVYGDVSKKRIRRQNPTMRNHHVIDGIFNIPITAIRQSAIAAQSFSPNNTRNIDNVAKISVSTLEAVDTLVKSMIEQRQRNIQDFRDGKRYRPVREEQQNDRRDKIQKKRLLQYELNRTIKHHHRDPLGLNALSNLLIGHHGILGGQHVGGFLGNRPGLTGHHGHHGHHGFHGGHGILASHGGHGTPANRPQNIYAVHEDLDNDTLFSWHGVIAGLGNLFGTRPSSTAVKMENKVAPKEKKQQKIYKYSNDDVNKLTKIRNKSKPGYNDPPLENKIAPRNGKITFVR